LTTVILTPGACVMEIWFSEKIGHRAARTFGRVWWSGIVLGNFKYEKIRSTANGSYVNCLASP